MFLMVGLGNPGAEYEKTRHNIGFMMADSISAHYNFPKTKSKFFSQTTEGTIANNKIVILKPQTYMNRSGKSVLEAANFLKIPLENIIVIHDDLDLATGKVRVKIGGGSGGHNGLKDIDSRLGKEYTRIRIGIGHPGDKNLVSSYVLHNFAKEEQHNIERTVDGITNNIELLLSGNKDLFLSKIAG